MSHPEISDSWFLDQPSARHTIGAAGTASTAIPTIPTIKGA